MTLQRHNAKWIIIFKQGRNPNVLKDRYLHFSLNQGDTIAFP